MKILAISGSIRSDSSNVSLLKAIRKLLPADYEWNDFKLNELPYFDPQHQFGPETPSSVLTFRKLAKDCDYLVISTPEYAHGIPGILKNALEWLVCEETINKKVLVFIATPAGGEYVKEYLLETLKTMDMKADEQTTINVQSARKDISLDGDIKDSKLDNILLEFLNPFFNL